MRKQPTTAKVWTKPEIKRLGELKDVRGSGVAGSQSTMS